MNNGLLLDTHCWIWQQAGWVKQFSRPALRQIELASNRGACFISVISVWELGVLHAHNRLQLKCPPQDWVAQALASPGTALAPLSVEIALESSALPGGFHGDPADRILVATARLQDLTLVTADERILAYAQSGYLNVIEAR